MIWVNGNHYQFLSEAEHILLVIIIIIFITHFGSDGYTQPFHINRLMVS